MILIIELGIDEVIGGLLFILLFVFIFCLVNDENEEMDLYGL